MMTDKDFIQEVFEITFGDGAICVPEESGLPREFTKEEVLEQLEFLLNIETGEE